MSKATAIIMFILAFVQITYGGGLILFENDLIGLILLVSGFILIPCAMIVSQSSASLANQDSDAN